MLSDKMVITNGRDRFGYVRHVRLIGEQTGVSEPVFPRMCTASKRPGGYVSGSGSATILCVGVRPQNGPAAMKRIPLSKTV